MLYLGNITIGLLAWSPSGGLVLRFASDHDRLHQVYIGRRLMGQTKSNSSREVTLQYDPSGSRYPEHVAVIAVDPEDEGIDHGEALPPRPYNRVRAAFPAQTLTGNDIVDDVRLWELFTGDEPEGAINYDVPRDAVVAEDNNPYELQSQPLGPSGEWSIGVRGRDNTELGGNVGTPAEGTAEILAYPPDFEEAFAVAVAAGTATLTCTIPED